MTSEAIQQLAVMAGSLMTIIGFVVYLVRPIVVTFKSLTTTLDKMNHRLDLINKDLEGKEKEHQSVVTRVSELEKVTDTHEVAIGKIVTSLEFIKIK